MQAANAFWNVLVSVDAGMSNTTRAPRPARLADAPEVPGMSTRAAAAELDRRGFATPIGAKWSDMAVSRGRERLAA